MTKLAHVSRLNASVGLRDMRAASAAPTRWQGMRGRRGPKWEILCGDARQVLKSLPEESFSCAITSPPYFWQRDYGVSGQIGMEGSVDEYVNSIVETMDEVKRVLKRNGTLFLNLGDTYYSGKGRPHGHDPKHSARRMSVIRAVDASGLGFPKKSLLGIPWRVALAMIKHGWVLRAPIIWRRKRPLPEANVLDRPWRTYEFVFLFAKSRKYNFSRDPLDAADCEDVWTIDARAVAGRTHPATFPAELVRRCLDLANVRSGKVLDPFGGSCTVIDVALEKGLSATAVELNEGFCVQAARKLEGV